MRQLDQPPCRWRSVLRVGFERLTPWAMCSIAVRLDDTQTASMVLLMQLEHYTATILESWDAKYSSCRRHVRRALAAAEAPGGSTADLIWTPSQIVLLDVDEDDVLRVCRRYTAAPGVSGLAPNHPRASTPQRLRLGYLSYSFGLGVRNGLMYNVFAAHDRERVEVFGFAIRPHDDDADAATRARVEKNVEHFVDISRVQVEQVAALMNSLEIHVLVDICGLHANGTTLYRTILARRPAGVQVACMALVAILHAYVLVAIMHAIMHACIPASVHMHTCTRTAHEGGVYGLCRHDGRVIRRLPGHRLHHQPPGVPRGVQRGAHGAALLVPHQLAQRTFP